MTKTTNRRRVLRALAAGSAGLALAWREAGGQAAPEVKVGALTEFGQEFDSKVFEYEGVRSLALRLPAPKAPDPRVLEAGKGVFLTAYTLVCTHDGCEPGMPNADRVLICPCHFSTFNADGSVAGGLAKLSLGGIKLEVRQGQVFAVGKIARAA